MISTVEATALAAAAGLVARAVTRMIRRRRASWLRLEARLSRAEKQVAALTAANEFARQALERRDRDARVFRDALEREWKRNGEWFDDRVAESGKVLRG